MTLDPLPRAALTRRRLVSLGALGYAGLSLPRLWAAEREGKLAPRADACVLLFLNGGPSHLDMWDMKPQAPDGIRGEFKPIASSLPGYQVCELLPRMARLVDRATIVRSMRHGVNNSHAAAVYCAITGHDRGEQGGGARPTDHPTPGAVLAKVRPTEAVAVPHVCLPYITKEGAGGPPQPGFFAGFLGRAHDPLFVLRDPNADSFAVPEMSPPTEISPERLASRRALAEQLDGPPLRAGRDALAMHALQGRALELLTSSAVQGAFRLRDEAAADRERYGRNIYGQSVLLARRLIEAGTRLVTVSWAPDANATWDTHGGNFQKLKTQLLPQFDAACASLVEDLEARGMLERTLVAVLGDFGRTPKINNNNAGRDHWNHCYSVLLLGGGFQRGLIYGASDSIGAFPAAQPMTPGDLMATVYTALGVPPETELHDALGRAQRLIPQGEAVSALLV